MISNLAYPAASDEAAVPVRATTRLVWWTTCLVCVGLILLRLPGIVSAMELTVADQMSSEDLDPSLVNLSVRIAAYLGVILFAMVMILYLSFAALLERKLLPHGLRIAGDQRIGVFCLLIATLTVSAQVFAFIAGSLPTGPLEILWILAIAICIPLLYRHRWGAPDAMTMGQKIMLFVLSIMISALVSLL